VLSDVARRVIGRRHGGDADIVSALEGMNVNTPGANYGVSIKGVFDGQADPRVCMGRAKALHGAC
jgi:hypothetical protein